MTDDDLIRRGDALYAIAGWEIPSTAIAALPAVKVGVTTEDIDALAYCFWSIHPKDIPEPIGMPEGYKGGRRAWFFATEIRRILAALEPVAAPNPAVTVGVKPPFYFDRYINGVRMAEDVCVERETTIESAMLVAARIASKGPNGEAPVLVYRAPVTQPAPDPAAIREAALREAARLVSARCDAYVAEHGSYDYSTGTTEYPGDGAEWVEEWTDIESAILALIQKGAAEPTEYERKVAQMKKDFPNGI